MNKISINYARSLFKKYKTFEAFEEKRSHIKSTDLFEIIAHHGLKVSMIFGGNNNEVYWPEKIPEKYIDQYKLTKILAGGRTKGGDTFLNKLMDDGKKKLIAVEFKSKVKMQKDSLKATKIAYKEVALNRHTLIGKKDRMVIHDFDDESKNLLEDLDNWTYVHISEFYNEETFDDIRNSVLHNTLPIYTPWGYRPDLLNENFDKKLCDDTWAKMLKQKQAYGNSKGLFIGPTAIGKGTKQPVLFRNYWYPHYKNTTKAKRPCIVVSVNPSLVVLGGNVVKQLKDHLGSNLPVRTMVCASDVDLAPDEDKKDLDAFDLYTSVVHNNDQFQDIFETLKKDEVLWINTTLHSYWRVVKYLKVAGIKKCDLMFIDEVKNTVTNEISVFSDCLFDKFFPVTDRIGLDANIVDAEDENGKMVESSMKNTNIWRELYTKMSGKKAWELGWRRRDILLIQPWQDTGLPYKLQEAINDGKNGLIHIKGWRKPVPFHWIVSIMANIEARYRVPDITATLNRLSYKKNCNEHAKFANFIAPKLIKCLPKNKSKSDVLVRLKKLKWVSIYNLGAKSSSAIQREVSKIPYKYSDVVVNQDRMLTEGWDPGAHKKYPGWLNSWQMTDASSSKVKICQLGGRPARPGEDIFNMEKKFNYCILPVIVPSKLDKLVQLQKISETVRKVAQSLEIGEDVIEDSCIILPWANLPNYPVGPTKKGKNNNGVLVTLDAQTIMSSVVRTYRGYRFSPYTALVDELHDDLLPYYQNDMFPYTVKVREFQMKIFQNPKYKSFFKLFQGRQKNKKWGKPNTMWGQEHFANVRDVFLKIRKGTFWMMSEKKQIEAMKSWRNFKTTIEPNYHLKKYTDLIAQTKKVLDKGIGEGDLIKKVHKNSNSNNKNEAVFGAGSPSYSTCIKRPKDEMGKRPIDKGWESLPGGLGHGSMSNTGRTFYRMKKFKQKKGMPESYISRLKELHAEFKQLIDDYCEKMDVVKKNIRDDYDKISSHSVLCSNPILRMRYEELAKKHKLAVTTTAHIITQADNGKKNPEIRKMDKSNSMKNKTTLKKIFLDTLESLIQQKKFGSQDELVQTLEKSINDKNLIFPTGSAGASNRIIEIYYACVSNLSSNEKNQFQKKYLELLAKLQLKQVKVKENDKNVIIFAPTHNRLGKNAQHESTKNKKAV